MTKVIIADDHPIFRAGLVQTINREVDLKVVDEFENGEELLSRLSSVEFDAAIIDIDLPGRNGIEVLKEIKKLKPGIPVLILSAYSEERYGVRAIQAGANAYISKDENKSTLLESCGASKEIKNSLRLNSPKY